MMTMPTQSKDGFAHLAYYDAETQLSFVSRGETVEVCRGGYGEGVIATFTILTWPVGSASKTTLWFGVKCHEWILACYGYDWHHLWDTECDEATPIPQPELTRASFCSNCHVPIRRKNPEYGTYEEAR